MICVSYERSEMNGPRKITHLDFIKWLQPSTDGSSTMVQVQHLHCACHVAGKRHILLLLPNVQIAITPSAFSLSNTCPESHRDFNALSASNPSNNLPPKTCEARYRCGTPVARS